MAIAITRDKESAADLRRLARLCRDVSQARRLLAIASVIDGHSRTEAATAAGMDRQSLRDWVHRFNAEGPNVPDAAVTIHVEPEDKRKHQGIVVL